MLNQQVQVPEKESRFVLKGASRAEKRSFWKEVIASWETSAETATGFCRDRDIPFAQFIYWKKRFVSSTQEDESESVRFVQFPGPRTSVANVRLGWRDFVIEVNDGTGEQTLAMVLRAVGAVR